MKSDLKLSFGGMGVTTVLTIVFVVLKLCNVIAWSWWWVFAPLWIPFGIVVVLLIVFLAISFVQYLLKRRRYRP